MITSTNPTGGAAAWTVTNVDSSNQLRSVSCPTSNLCVAVDYFGNVVASNNPTGGAAAWTVANVYGGAGKVPPVRRVVPEHQPVRRR